LLCIQIINEHEALYKKFINLNEKAITKCHKFLFAVFLEILWIAPAEQSRTSIKQLMLKEGRLSRRSTVELLDYLDFF
jgi:hypothetical protein